MLESVSILEEENEQSVSATRNTSFELFRGLINGIASQYVSQHNITETQNGEEYRELKGSDLACRSVSGFSGKTFRREHRWHMANESMQNRSFSLIMIIISATQHIPLSRA